MFEKTSYSQQEFCNAIASSFSIRSALQKLGLSPTGANYALLRDRVQKLGLSISHFTGRGHLRNKTHSWGKKIPLESILIEGSTYTSANHLKKRLLKEQRLLNICSICGISSWNSRPLVLRLDHVNGKCRDHRFENLRLLCPNCDSQQPTFAGRNKGTY